MTITAQGYCRTCARPSDTPVCDRCEIEAEYLAERDADRRAEGREIHDLELAGYSLADAPVGPDDFENPADLEDELAW